MTMNGIETAFIARVGTEPELKVSQAGKPWTSFSACVGTQWVTVVAFGDRAQQLAGHLHKGDRVNAEGRLNLDTWTGKDGKERTGIKVAAWRVQQLGQIGKNKPANPKAPPEGEQPAPPSTVPQRDWQKPASAFDEIRSDKGANQHDHCPLIRVRLVASYGTKRTRELDDLEFSGATYD